MAHVLFDLGEAGKVKIRNALLNHPSTEHLAPAVKDGRSFTFLTEGVSFGDVPLDSAIEWSLEYATGHEYGSGNDEMFKTMVDLGKQRPGSTFVFVMRDTDEEAPDPEPFAEEVIPSLEYKVDPQNITVEQFEDYLNWFAVRFAGGCALIEGELPEAGLKTVAPNRLLAFIAEAFDEESHLIWRVD